MKRVKVIGEFFGRVISSESATSSKRFIAIWTMLLVTYVVIRYTNKGNLLGVLDSMLLFVLTLLGLAVWQSVKNEPKNKNDEQN